ncbi:fimbrial protein [Cronobacter turicensis]|nr:fimbrial protein [Cronobacter turicensis]EMA1868152.1 fimbrial protein [Cronobacter turicensis]TWR37471.1 fimbrial protein [Cronobacter turicensis]
MSVYFCYDGSGTSSFAAADIVHIAFSGCDYSQGYPPHSGNFRNKVIVSGPSGSPVYGSATTNPFYLDATKSIAEQSVATTGPSLVAVTVPANTPWKVCNYLVDDAGKLHYMFDSQIPCGSNPVPPTPPVPDTSCTINNGNTLSVSLGTLERSEIPTAPGSGSAKSIPFAVNCTGGNVTVNMQMNYTPISVGSSQAVKTSANGVGVSVLYDNKPLSTTDITPVTFLQGSNTLNLSFEAVRDAAVKLEDIPTGAFTANAVLVMTQQ